MSRLVVLAALLWGVVGVSPASPPVAPADPALVALVRQLGDLDPRARAQARSLLMQLRRSDLPALREATRYAGRLSPEQASALEEIVIHVHVSGIELPRQPWGFLGVELATPGVTPDGQLVEGEPGAIILSRMPGFPAYEALCDGDLVIGVDQAGEIPVRSGAELRAVISRFRAGDAIVLLVLRGGQIERVPLRLGARPAVVDQGPLLEALGAFVESAERYFDASFAPLMRRPESP